MGKMHLFADRDLLWAPLSLLIIYLYAMSRRRKIGHSHLQRYYTIGLHLRMLGTLLYAAVIEFYYQGGDTATFFHGTWIMHDATLVDSSMFWEAISSSKLDPNSQLADYFSMTSGPTQFYMYLAGNFTVSKLALPLSLIFSKSYLAISFFFSFFAFSGCWALFKMFYSLFPHLGKKIAIATLFLPSLIFWSSALMKDSLCIGAFGFFIVAIYQVVFIKKRVMSSLVTAIIMGILLLYVKPYILLCVIPAFLAWVFFNIRAKIKDFAYRSLATFLFFLVAIGGIVYFFQTIAASEIASQYAVENLLATLENQQDTYSHAREEGSYFTVGQFDDSPLSVLLLFPLGVVATLFRPFLWEIGSPIMLLTALESLAFVWLTFCVFKYCRMSQIRSAIRREPVLIFCIIYALTFAGLVGITTLNFGTLARYKIPALPLYLIFVFVLLDYSGRVKPGTILHKRLF